MGIHPKLDYDLVMAAGLDAGNRNMRKHGRTSWNIDDWNVAAETTEKLFSSKNYTGIN